MSGNQPRRQDTGREFSKAKGGHASGPQDSAPLPKPAELIAGIKGRLEKMDDGHGTLHLGEEVLIPTKNQKRLVNLVGQKDIVFVDGPIGTGKTIWACYAGLKGLAEGRFRRIALTAPVVEADEQIGFLTGGLDEKMEVHVNQILEAFDDLVGKGFRVQMQQAGMLEIAPHAFNRGRTYKNTLYILDESQNASARQLMTSIGRLGFKATLVYMGDDRQNDRTTGRSAYVSFAKRFSDAAYGQYVGSVTMGKEDVRRHPLLQLMVERGDDRPLEGFEGREDSKVSRRPGAGPAPSVS